MIRQTRPNRMDTIASLNADLPLLRAVLGRRQSQHADIWIRPCSVRNLSGWPRHTSLVYGNFAPILEPFPACFPGRKFAHMDRGDIAGCKRRLVLCAHSLGKRDDYRSVRIGLGRGTRAPRFPQASDRRLLYGFSESPGTIAWRMASLRCTTPPKWRARWAGMTGDRALHVGASSFRRGLRGVGAAHFAYATYTAKNGTAWLLGRTGLAYLTGACHAAAGFGLLFGVLPRLAATLEAI